MAPAMTRSSPQRARKPIGWRWAWYSAASSVSEYGDVAAAKLATSPAAASLSHNRTRPPGLSWVACAASA
jgi:hypothetical protein